MQLHDFDYDLPAELIAQRPPPERRASRLLELAAGAGPRDLRFADLPTLLYAGDLLVFNDTRVLRARLFARKASGGRAEVLVERLAGPGRCIAHVRASRAPATGSLLRFGDDAMARVSGRAGGLFELEIESGAGFEDLMRTRGALPLPPYIRRDAEAFDEDRYQTVYARHDGAVAAPTAGLHFDEAMLDDLRARGVASAHVTLHVGAGTFQPVRAERIEEHRMHAERVEVGEDACEQVARARERGARVIAVGTTVVRSLEAASLGGSLGPFRGETDLFIRPGFRFRCVDAMLTNFHLPRSTLLMLVCAFAGTARVLEAYRHAVARGYRFFSYGDAMFLGGAA